MNTILIGNPGVGKSTILNCLLGKVEVFKSGISFGGGLTKNLQIYEDDGGNKFVDTPGLSDIKSRKQAALEIERGLKTGGLFKVFFVITLEGGRVRADDKSTIKLVLESIPLVGNKYSIIINKLSPGVLMQLESSEEDKNVLLTNILDDLPISFSIFYNRHYNELDGNAKTVLFDETFLDFIKIAPVIRITEEKVQAIAIDEFEVNSEMWTAKLEAMRTDQKVMMDSMKKIQERFLVAKEKMEEQHRHEIANKQERKLFDNIEELKNRNEPINGMGYVQKILREQNEVDRLNKEANIDQQQKQQKQKEFSFGDFKEKCVML